MGTKTLAELMEEQKNTEVINVEFDNEDDFDDDDSKEIENAQGFEAEEENDEEIDDDSDEDSQKRKKDRRNRRIQALTRQKNELLDKANREAAERERIQKELEDLKNRYASEQAVSMSSKVESLEKERQRILKMIKQAKLDDDIDAEIELTAELSDLSYQLRVVKEAEASKPKEVEKPKLPEQRQRQIQQEPPEKAKDWATENYWFLKPETRDEEQLRMYAQKVAKELIADGFDPEEDDLYEELNNSIKEYAQKRGLSVKGVYVEQKTKRQTKSPTSGSRTTASGKKTYKLTAEEQEFIKTARIDATEYIRRRESIKKAGDEGGFSTMRLRDY